MAERTGIVYVVGAGPGDPELITVRGLALVRSAEVLVHDRLVHGALIDEAPGTAARFDVGKAPGLQPWPQERINALLVGQARRGRRVVRLKGGDPFVYGRGGEECLALATAGVPFEVVPGVSSAIAVPASAGIPVTHREVGRTFTVVSGQTSDGVEPDWDAAARADTIVVLMGTRRLAWIARRLVQAGRAETTPAAVVRCGTTGAQRVARGTLADIAGRARGLAPPAVIVVGEVVRLAGALPWFRAGVGDVDPFGDSDTAPDGVKVAS